MIWHSLLLAVLAGSSLATPPCNPRTDDQCLARNPGLKSPIFVPFTRTSGNFKVAPTPGKVEYCKDGAKLTLEKRLDNPTLVSKFYILYGKVEAELKAAPGQGIVSSFYLQSDDLDEIDIAETFGGDPYEIQTNFFVKGNITNFARGGYHSAPVPPMYHYIRYGLEWTPSKITWYVNGKSIRVVDRNSNHGYPDSPMAIKFSIWAGGESTNLPGTIAWAGGLTDYSKAPFSMYVKNVRVYDMTAGKEYVYGNGPSGWIDIASAQNVRSQSTNPVRRIADVVSSLDYDDDEFNPMFTESDTEDMSDEEEFCTQCEETTTKTRKSRATSFYDEFIQDTRTLTAQSSSHTYSYLYVLLTLLTELFMLAI